MKIFTDKAFEKRLAHEIELRERDRYIHERIDRLCEKIEQLKWRVDELQGMTKGRVATPVNKGSDNAYWVISVYKKNCADDYPNSPKDGKDAKVCFEQDCDMELAFAKANVAVKKWLLENEGGY